MDIDGLEGTVWIMDNNKQNDDKKLGRKLDMNELEQVTGGAGDSTSYLFFEGESEEQKDDYYSIWCGVEPVQ